MPRSSRSAPTPTASSRASRSSRTGAASGSRSPWLGLVQRLPQPAGDLVHFTLSFWMMLPLRRRSWPRSSACCSAPRRCGCAATISRSSRWASARSCRSWCATGLAHQWRCRASTASQAPHAVRPQFRRRARTPYYYVAIALVALLIFISIRLRDSRDRPRLDGDPRGRDRRRRDGRESHPLQAAGVRDRRRLRRRDRRVLRRQTADRDAGDVRLSGLGDDPGHGRARRHRQRLGRRARRASSCNSCNPGGSRICRAGLHVVRHSWSAVRSLAEGRSARGRSS